MIVFVAVSTNQILHSLKIVSNLVPKKLTLGCVKAWFYPPNLGSPVLLLLFDCCVVVGAIWSGNCCQPIDHRCHRRALPASATAAFPVIGLDFIAGTSSIAPPCFLPRLGC